MPIEPILHHVFDFFACCMMISRRLRQSYLMDCKDQDGMLLWRDRYLLNYVLIA